MATNLPPPPGQANAEMNLGDRQVTGSAEIDA